MKTLLSTAAAIAIVATSAFAQTAPRTFVFENQTWVIEGPGGPGVSRVMMTPGFGKVCTTRVIKIESVAVTTGGKSVAMTKEQKFRGDKRWHAVCFFDAPAELRDLANAAPQASN